MSISSVLMKIIFQKAPIVTQAIRYMIKDISAFPFIQSYWLLSNCSCSLLPMESLGLCNSVTYPLPVRMDKFTCTPTQKQAKQDTFSLKFLRAVGSLAVKYDWLMEDTTYLLLPLLLFFLWSFYSFFYLVLRFHISLLLCCLLHPPTHLDIPPACTCSVSHLPLITLPVDIHTTFFSHFASLGVYISQWKWEIAPPYSHLQQYKSAPCYVFPQLWKHPFCEKCIHTTIVLIWLLGKKFVTAHMRLNGRSVVM